ncbi:MAG: ribosome small subunit-dependent GTPase A, partial [Deltaproteobacteria bacterium]|nr:ribosome small subunit-dependent GTPase A [Deltaproteobacteria bacterium]
VSALAADGMQALEGVLASGLTAVLLGSSGVGKSTLVNILSGSGVQAVSPIRDCDSKGRHTTTARRLVHLPKSGAMIIDTPGMRELAVWEGEQGLGAAFEDIERLVLACRFRDCSHLTEPGCAVKAAVAGGGLEAGRLESYRKLEREVAYQTRKHDKAAMSEQKKRWRKAHLEHRRRDRTNWK